jgi:hypothetical protein
MEKNIYNYQRSIREGIKDHPVPEVPNRRPNNPHHTKKYDEDGKPVFVQVKLTTDYTRPGRYQGVD